MEEERKPETSQETNEGQKEVYFACPYCWERISMLLDLSVPFQTFIEDCEVCCHPIEVSYSTEEGAVSRFELSKAQ